MISEELMSKVWEAYQGDPMDPKNNTEAGIKRVVEVVLENAPAPSPQTKMSGLESDPATLRGYCQQLLDMFENYGVEIEDEDNELIAHISKSVDPAHVEPAETTEARPDA